MLFRKSLLNRKRLAFRVFVFCILIIAVFSACSTQKTGYSSVCGLYIRTESGQNVLIDQTGSIVLMQIADTPDLSNDVFSGLLTGYKIKVTMASVPYEEHNGYYVINVYDVKCLSKEQAVIDIATISRIESLMFDSV